jgi:hypothetical protein
MAFMMLDELEKRQSIDQKCKVLPFTPLATLRLSFPLKPLSIMTIDSGSPRTLVRVGGIRKLQDIWQDSVTTLTWWI